MSSREDTTDPARRRLLREAALMLAGLGAAGLGAGCEGRGRAPPRGTQPPEADAGQLTASAPPRALHPPQRAALEAASARILPTDHEPGAREAEVIEYIDRELTRPEYSAVKKVMLAGVVALDKVAQRNAARPFAQLTPEEQDAVLATVQHASDRGRDFVKLLVAFTLEGFAGDPSYGGNKAGVGWGFVGYGPGNPDGTRTVGHGGHGSH